MVKGETAGVEDFGAVRTKTPLALVIPIANRSHFTFHHLQLDPHQAKPPHPPCYHRSPRHSTLLRSGDYCSRCPARQQAGRVKRETGAPYSARQSLCCPRNGQRGPAPFAQRQPRDGYHWKRQFPGRWCRAGARMSACAASTRKPGYRPCPAVVRLRGVRLWRARPFMTAVCRHACVPRLTV